MDYWKECIAEAAEECGANLTEEQISSMAYFVEGAHENYRQATGLDVADQNWRANNDKEILKKGMDKVFRFIEDIVSTIDCGPSRAFDYFNHEQKIAMHKLFSAREFCKQQ